MKDSRIQKITSATILGLPSDCHTKHRQSFADVLQKDVLPKAVLTPVLFSETLFKEIIN